jgi:hypothetical protein
MFPLALVAALPEATTAFVTKIAQLIPPLSPPLVTTLLAQATLLLVAAIWWLWWRLPRRQVRRLDIQIHDPKARADTEDNFRKTVGQALGGVAVLIGAGFGLFQFLQQQKTASEQQRTAAEQFAQQQKTTSEQALAQQRAAHDLLISNQVSKGFEQLASDKMAERLGGIYALEGVMNTSDQYRQPVLEALCAFVREGAKAVAPASEKMASKHNPANTDMKALNTASKHRTAPDSFSIPLDLARRLAGRFEAAAAAPPKHPAADIEAALTVIGRRNPVPGHVNLAGANISGANLSEAHLEDADLRGAHLEDAILDGAHLEDAYLAVAHLAGAGLTGAHLDRADLVLAHLEHATLDGAHLDRAELSLAHLEHGIHPARDVWAHSTRHARF